MCGQTYGTILQGLRHFLHIISNLMELFTSEMNKFPEFSLKFVAQLHFTITSAFRAPAFSANIIPKPKLADELKSLPLFRRRQASPARLGDSSRTFGPAPAAGSSFQASMVVRDLGRSGRM